MNPDQKTNGIPEIGGGRRVLVAAAVPLIAGALQWALPDHGSAHPWLLFYPAVLASAALGRAWGAWIATGISCLLVWYGASRLQISPVGPTSMKLAAGAVFVGVGFALGVVFDWLHRMERSGLKLKQQLSDGAVTSRQLTETTQELVRIKALMEANEELFHTTFDQAAVGIAHVNLDGRCIRVNQRICEMTGYSGEEMLTKTIRDLTHPQDLERTLAEVKRVLDGELPTYRIEKRYIRKDGSVLPASVTSSIARSAAGEPLYFIAVVEDITERRRAEENLRQNLLFRREAEKIGRIGAWKVSPTTDYLYWTEGVYEIVEMPLDYKPGLEEGLRFYDADSIPILREALGKALVDGTPFTLELGLTTGKGRHLWTEVRGLGRLVEGEQAFVMGTFQDITARSKAEAALRESEEQFRTVVEGTNVPLYVGIDLVFAYLNPAAVELFGAKSDSDLLGLSVLDRIHPSFHKQVVERAKLVCKEHRGAAPVTEETYIRMDGTSIYVEATASPIQFQGKPGAVVFAQNITARKVAEAAYTRLATAVEQAGDAIVITDRDGTIQYANPAFERSSGYARAEALGQNPRLLKSGRQDADFYRGMWDVLTQGKVWSGHLVNKRKDGTLYEEEATISPILDESGEIINFVAVKRDVSRELQLQEEIRQAQKMEAIGRLAGGVAHDFNNILAVMLLQTDLAESSEGIPPEVRDSLREIRSSAKRASNLTRQLLLFSRRQVLQSKDLDLNDSVATLVRMLRRIVGEDVLLKLNLSAEPLFTHADPGMLDQILMNLTVNARDAMPDGGELTIETSRVTITHAEARLNPEASPGSYVLLTVRDTGAGIPPEVLPRIFEPFFTTKKAGQGTGLGLATVFGIVKQHHGWIKVETELRKGTTFKIHLPAIQRPPAPTISLERTAWPADLRGKETILLAEDDPAVRSGLRGLLEHQGYKVVEAEDGTEALRRWEQHGPSIDLLLTDLVMPGGLTGLELAHRLKSIRPNLRVILTSGYSVDIAGRNLELLPGEEFLQKPFAPEQLLELLRHCLGARAQTQGREC